MKIQHIAIGARFEYEGIVYVKTGPLTASSEQGGQRIIPRYAVLRSLDGTDEAQGKPVAGSASVRPAFAQFYAIAEQLVAPADRAKLAEARVRFLKALD